MDSHSALQPPTKQHDNLTSAQPESATPLPEAHENENAAATILDAANAVGSGPHEPEAQTATTTEEIEGSESAVNEPATYGTRSRNRTSNVRPNYAEDQEMDFELAAPPAAAKTAIAKNASSSGRNQAASDAKRILPDTTSSRFASINGADQAEKSPSSGRDPITGTSTFSSNPPKKRKAGGSATAGAAAVPAATAQPSTKRQTATSAYIPPANMSRESNMMTFEKSKAFLKKGGLVADDGAVLRVDGKCDRRRPYMTAR